MLTATCRVGRFVELRFSGNPTLEDAARFEVAAHACIAACSKSTKKAVVICTDLRASYLLNPTVTDRLIQTMRRENSNLERNGLVGTGSALFTLQLMRVIREAAPDARRRVFTQIEPLVAWLDELLDVQERVRLRQFLAELDPTTLQAPPPASVPTDNPPGASVRIDSRRSRMNRR